MFHVLQFWFLVVHNPERIHQQKIKILFANYIRNYIEIALVGRKSLLNRFNNSFATYKFLYLITSLLTFNSTSNEFTYFRVNHWIIGPDLSERSSLSLRTPHWLVYLYFFAILFQCYNYVGMWNLPEICSFFNKFTEISFVDALS